MEESEFTNFSINELKLDKECVRQPLLVHHWTSKESKRKYNYDYYVAQLEFLKAKTANKIRESISANSNKKMTAGEINDLVACDKEVLAITNKVLDLRRLLEEAKACVVTLEHRKKSIEGLIQLQGRDYFSSPRVVAKP